MKTDRNRHERDRQDDYVLSGHIKKAIIYFLVGVAAALAGDTAMFFRWWGVMILFYALFIIVCVWMVKELKRQDRIDYENYRRTRYAISRQEGEINDLKKELSRKADKPVGSNIRPGSRPSEAFLKLIGGEALDDRREDQRDPAIQEVHVER